MALVLSILKGETSVADAARKHGLTIAEIEDWREKFLAGAENALRSHPRNYERLKDEMIKKLQRKIGEMTLDMDILKEAIKPYRPFQEGVDQQRTRETHSVSRDERVSQMLGASQRRVCRTLAVSRSSRRPLPPCPTG